MESSPFRFSPRPNRAHQIRWREWDEDAFQEAQRLDRPILLAISAVWCHWCHVMDETSYSHPGVIELLNREYIPIRVDNDRRPDVNQRYNMGGWPTTALLTPGGDVLTGATYLPPEALEALLRQVLTYYRSHKAEVYSKILELKARARTTAAPQGPLPSQATKEVLDNLTQLYDPEYGGFGSAPKFPQTESLELLLEEHYRTGGEPWAQMARKTLRDMAAGGIFDQVAGGFFRYSTTRDWNIPHYEKMSEDNADFLRLYTHAAQALGEKDFANTAERVVDYVLSTLYRPEQGTFAGSQDADEEYYQLPGPQRVERQPPLVDHTVYTNWNAAMASAFLEAARALDRPSLEMTALRALDFLWAKNYEPGRGMYHYHDGQARAPGLLIDQAWMLQALLDAYQSTGEPAYLERAQELGQVIYDHFQDREGGGFFDTQADHQNLGRLGERDKSIVESSLLAEACQRLFHLTGQEHHTMAAQSALQVFAQDYLRYGPYAASYARALERLRGDPLHIVVVGLEKEDATRALRRASLSFFHPNRVVQTLDPSRDRQRLEQGGFPLEETPRAYICQRGACSAPVENPQELAAALKRPL